MASIQYVVNATDAASAVFAKIAASADGLDKQLEDLGKRVADPEVNLQDSKFTLGIVRAAERLDKLSAMVADPEVEVDTAKAQTEILRINAMLDRLDAKRVSVTVDVDRRGGIFSRIAGGIGGLGRLLGGGASAIGGGIGAVGSGIGALGSAGGQAGQALQAGGIFAAIAAALTTAPALLPLGLGGLVGGGAAAGALMLGSKGAAALKADRQALARARASMAGTKGPGSPSQLLTLHLAQQKLAHDQGQFGGFASLNQVFSGLGRTALGVFSGALTSQGKGFSFAGPNQSFLTGLVGILKQLAGFIKTIGPSLGDMFRASVPYLQMFVKFLEKATTALLPAFTKMLVEFQPYLPVIAHGLMNIVKGMVGFLNAIGPSGMKAAARIFVILTEGMAAALVALGHTINWLTENIPTWTRKIHNEWDILRHETAVIFDGIRHEIAHVWDQIFSNTIGSVIRLAHNVATQFNSLRHSVANIYDGVRHDIAHVWDVIWNNTVGRVQRGVADVNGWFHRLPGMILHSLFGLGHSLGSFAAAALNEMWSGFKRIGSGIVGWIKNFAGGIVSVFKKIWGIFSPSSVFAGLGVNLMQGLEKGIKSHARHVQNAVAGSVKYNVGAGVQQWAGLVRQALAMEGLSPMLAGRVLFQMQTESGGKPNAINNWDSNAAAGDPSRGLMQVIGSTFAAYHWPGTSWNIYNPLANIAAAINYARHRYGPTLMSGGMGMGSGHGYAYGTNAAYPGWAWVGERGPELVRFRGGESVRPGGAGNTYQITVNVPPSANKADVGRQVVDVIREYERRSGTSWRR